VSGPAHPLLKQWAAAPIEVAGAFSEMFRLLAAISA
jgi:hypothetical protein